MSKISVIPGNSICPLSAKKKNKKVEDGNKQFGFCCATGDYDSLTKYDQRNPPFKSSLTAINSIHECPVLKIRTQFIENRSSISKKKGYKNKSGSATDRSQWISKNNSTSAPGTLGKYLEDEINLAIIQYTQQKIEAFNEEGKKNVQLAEEKAIAESSKIKKSPYPHWYQDFSNLQMRHLMALKEALCADYKEKATHRTQNILLAIGIISTVFKLTPHVISTLLHKSNLRPVDFLRETYKIKTGYDFEDEDYKREYNCNERLILSGIAFLTLPETIIELHERLPPIKIPKYPPKPPPPQVLYPKKMDSPYKEKLFLQPDLRLYQIELYNWRKKMELIPKPKVILPPKKESSVCDDYLTIIQETEEKVNGGSKEKGFHTIEKKTIRRNKSTKKLVKMNSKKEKENHDVENNNENSKLNKEQFDFTLSGLGEGVGPVEYKICGTLDPSERKYKSWLGEKDLHYVISGIINEDQPPQGPVTYELTGFAKVTPNNSNEEFFANLKLGDGPRKIHPRGRKYLSKNWQEWLQNVDEEFLKAEKEANKLIESVEATMKLVIPGPTCDSCCACRQTRKTNLKKHATKTPHMVIDSIAEDANNKRYIVGSMSMQSPAPSLAESTVNLLEVVASHDKITKNLLINGITNDDGETIYYISGVAKDIEHVPEEKIEKIIPKSIKNVPPCACAIEKMFNEGLDPEQSDDNIPITNDGTCFGKKYRPGDGPAYSCKQYPGDKSCGRNPFLKSFQENWKKGKMRKVDKDFYTPSERNMYSLPDFQPCGDEDGMAVCGGPWGAVNIPSPEELARREEEERQILKAPPCGEKPGQSVCGGPWGTKVPKPKPPKKEDKDEDEEDEEDEEQEAKVSEEKPVESLIVKKKALNRDKGCHMSPENLEDVSEPQDGIGIKESGSNKFRDEIDWNAKRTAPPAKEVKKSIYEKGLSLTQAQPQVSEITRKYEKRDKIESKGKRDRKDERTKEKLTSIPPPAKKKEDVDSKQSNIKVGKIKSKRLVNSARKPARRRDDKIDPSKDNRKIDISNKTKNLPKYAKSKIIKNNNFVKSSQKLSTLTAPRARIQKKSSDSYNENIEEGVKKTASSRILSKHEKLKQLKDEMQDFKMLEMEVKPAVIPEEEPKSCKGDAKYEARCCEMTDSPVEKNKISNKEGPFGWRTESEQKLEPQKTLIYLTEPTYPIETVPVRPGGKACHCRENRNKKKILKYNIGGLLNKVEEKRKKLQNVTQVIEGLTYVTPPPSPRRSDEYIPEYELYESPYDMCLRRKTDNVLKLTEKFLGPPSLVVKKPENNSSCGCGYEDSSNGIDASEKKNLENILEKNWTTENAPNEWSDAFKDPGLVDFFTRCRDDVPCWLKCSQFSKSGCCDNVRKLQVKKPVCECKYERKIVQRNEQKQKWLERQERLKSYKKTPFTNIVGISRPMESDNKFIISGVKRILNEDGNDEVKYCVSGVAENYTMGPVQYLIDGVNMQTPLVTPKPSEKSIPCFCAHKHWSVTQLPENMTSADKEEVENFGGRTKENVRPKKCYDAAKCNELANVKEISNSQAIAIENKNTKDEEFKNEEHKLVKTKGRRKDNKNVTRDASIDHKKDLIKAESSNLIKTHGEEPLEKSKFRKSNPQQLNSNIELKKKKVNKYVDDGLDLMQIVIKELNEMAKEGFTFAKLPKCYKMPQIQYWVMYREGALFTDEIKEEIMQRSHLSWNKLKATKFSNIEPPSMDLTRSEIKNLNFENVFKLKEQIRAKKDTFYNQIRQNRVNRSAALWNTMEFGKFPNLSFKETYFTYLPAKETDGHILEPY